MRASFDDLLNTLRAVRPGRLIVLLLASVVAGLVSDWFRREQRLVFPRPLPVFRTTLPTR